MYAYSKKAQGEQVKVNYMTVMFLVKQHSMKILLLLTIFLCLFSFVKVDPDIIGTWQANLPNNIIGIMKYKKDSTFEVLVNKKAFASGKYRYSNNMLTFVEDNGCMDQSVRHLEGVYKINFLAPDSIQFELIYDSCYRRRQTLPQLKCNKIEKGLSL